MIRLSAMKMIHNNDDPRDNTTLLDAGHHRLPGHLMLVVEEEMQGVLVDEEKDVDHKVVEVEVVEVDSKEDVEEGEGVHLKDVVKEDGEEGEGDELSLDEDQLVEEVRCFV